MSGDILSFQVKNLRSIKDSGLLDLPALTILIGENGSGKSSFMRFFQILQQSVGVSQKGALSFYGDYVDFGSFSESIHQFCNEEEDYIGFSVKLNYIKCRFLSNRGNALINLKEPTVELRVKEANDLIYCSFIQINAYDDIIVIEIDKDDGIESVVINGINLTNEAASFKKLIHKNFIPIYVDRTSDDQGMSWLREDRAGVKALREQIRELAGKKIGKEKIDNIFKVAYGSHEDLIQNLKTAIDGVNWRNNTANLSVTDEWYKKIRAKIIFSFITYMLAGVSEAMDRVIDSIHYVGPARATAQRYYRLQALDVSKIDPSGLNVPTFIKSLTKKEFNDFIDWVNKYFQFKLDREKLTGHTAIRINDLPTHDKTGFNLADMGFGYSQVLPILLQLWHFSQNKKRQYRNKHKIFLIEQPELHLHPAFQAKLVQAFIDTIEESPPYGNVKLIIETHSEIIINMLGQAIINNKINHDKTAIYIFEKKEGCCEIKKSTFKQNGCLENWPYGFFSGE